LVSLRTARRFFQIVQQVGGGDGDLGAGLGQHAAQAFDVGVMAAQVDGQRQRHGDEAGVLAAVEENQEIGAGFGNQGDARTTRDAGTRKALRQGDGAVTHFPVGERYLQLAARGEEIAPGFPFSGIVQPLDQGLEFCNAK
jgi:hypothetical protein